MTDVDSPLATARHLAATGRLDEAARAYRALQGQVPAEATEYLGIYALRQQRWADAAAALEDVARLAPENWTALENLGLAYERLGAADRADDVLRRVLAHRPEFFVARLLLGFVERARGRPLAAMVQMEHAFQLAHQRGFWRDGATTQPWLREHMRDATAFVTSVRRELAAKVAAAATPAALPRVEAFIRAQFGLERVQSPDPRQAPKKHLFPGLPPSPWLDPALFPWARRLQEAFPQILAEYLAVAGAGPGFESFLTFKSAEQVAKYLGTTGPAPAWNAYFFYRHGVRNDENCARCPVTAALLDELPLIKLPGTTPEICFSVLTPGSHILPHRGDSNLRSVVHLGLVVPPGCALNVGGEPRSWAPGEVLAFDDTYEHEAWNRSDATRAILLMDAWNPHLEEAEKQALPAVVKALADVSTEVAQLRAQA
jgi:aspartate beta-hydroxylase